MGRLRITVPLLLSSFLVMSSPILAVEPDHPFDIDLHNPAALREANRVLAEELKLAGRPQAYLILDLVANAIVIKARGLELHRMAITGWSVGPREALAGTFRLTARPSVVRRKIDPSASAIQDPISLTDMPTRFTLTFQPPLTLEVLPGDREGYSWMVSYLIDWWERLKTWVLDLTSNQPPPAPSRIWLGLQADHAQSLAWALVDGMPLLIRQPHDR